MKQFKTLINGVTQEWKLSDYDNDQQLFMKDYKIYKEKGLLLERKEDVSMEVLEVTSKLLSESIEELKESRKEEKVKMKKLQDKVKELYEELESYHSYDYYEAVYDDVMMMISEYDMVNEYLTYEELYDLFINEDGVTGNGSGSYTFNSLQARKNVFANWDLLLEAVVNLDSRINEDMEVNDILIRMYVLSDVLHDVVEEVNSKLEDEE